MLNYKGYTGTGRVNTETLLLRGEVDDVDLYTPYSGVTVFELTTNFRLAVDEFITGRTFAGVAKPEVGRCS